MIQIQPWEASLIKDIEKAILVSELGITPNNDGKVIRLVFPELTEDRRKELAKDIKREEIRMNKLEANLRLKHMERLNRRECSPEFTVIYTDVIHYIEKIGDCCDNIANKVLDDINIKEAEAKEN